MYGNPSIPYNLTMNMQHVALTGILATGATTFTATPVGTAAAISYCIHGKSYTKATISGGATPTTDAVTLAAFVSVPASSSCIVVLALDASGNIKAVQGPVGLVAVAPYPEFPMLPESLCAIGYVKIVAASTGTGFTFGTSNWNATGMTCTPVAVICLPNRPQIA